MANMIKLIAETKKIEKEELLSIPLKRSERRYNLIHVFVCS